MSELLFRQNYKVDSTIVMNLITCCDCGLPFMAPLNWVTQRRDDKKSFYCPNGHPMHYIKSEIDAEKEQLKKELENAQLLARERINELANARYLSDSVQRENNKLRRTLKRVHNGVCPCCNRTFQNLVKHMKTMHPELVNSKKK